MPRVPPPGGVVDWPADEGTLGVVGVAPWATLDFCRALYAEIDATKDWHFPRVLLDINTKIPSRGRHLQLGEADPSAAIAATIAELADRGATLAVVPCNTAHVLFDRWAALAPIPVLHIVDETVSAAARRGANRCVPLVSRSLAAHDLYATRAEAAGLSAVRLAGRDQETVCAAIEAVKIAGRLSSALEESLLELLRRVRAAGADTVLAGCTELSSLAAVCASVGLGFVDSNRALARSSLVALRLSPRLLRGGARG